MTLQIISQYGITLYTEPVTSFKHADELISIYASETDKCYVTAVSSMRTSLPRQKRYTFKTTNNGDQRVFAENGRILSNAEVRRMNQQTA